MQPTPLTPMNADEDSYLQQHILRHELRHFIGTARLKLEYLKQSTRHLESEVAREIGEVHQLVVQAELLMEGLGQPLRNTEPQDECPDNLQAILAIITEFQERNPTIAFKHTFATSALVLSPITTLHWRQLLYNIFNNAIESLAGTTGAMLYISFYFDQGFGVLEVHDNGPGFPSHLSPQQLVMPYVSLRPEAEDAPKKSANGVDLLQLSPRGLGLYVCQRIMKSVNGDLRLGKSLWNGACIKLTFPAMEAFD